MERGGSFSDSHRVHPESRKNDKGIKRMKNKRTIGNRPVLRACIAEEHAPHRGIGCRSGTGRRRRAQQHTKHRILQLTINSALRPDIRFICRTFGP